MKIFTSKKIKTISSIILVILFVQLCSPLIVLASNSPTQAETTAFSPPSTTDLVNPFTGEFSYSLPLLEVPNSSGNNFPLTLSYKSGTTIDEDASWVGYGWSLPIGAIGRTKRGFPDDLKPNGSNITYYHKQPKVTTISAGGNVSGEIFDFELPASGNFSIRYNSLSGFTWATGFSVSFLSTLNLNLGLDDNGANFDATISPMGALRAGLKESKLFEDQSLKNVNLMLKNSTVSRINWSARSMGLFGATSPQARAISTYTPSYSGENWSGSISLKADPTPVPAGTTAGIFGSYTWSKPSSDYTILRAFGAMYSDEAESNSTSMMDYYHERVRPFKLKKSRYLSVPMVNYDNYSLSAPGFSGSFKLHHRKNGYYGPSETKSTTAIANIDPEVELGAGILGLGANVGGGASTNKNGRARTYDANDKRTFKNASQAKNVYFRFNNDLGGNVLHGYDDHPAVPQVNNPGEISQEQMFLSENEGGYSGSSTSIEYEKIENGTRMAFRTIPSRTNEQIGKFITTNSNGMKYVYGQPVFSKDEYSMTYGLPKYANSSSNPNLYIDNGTVEYRPDNIGENTGLERISGNALKQPYANSYLLTQILTQDYIDFNSNEVCDEGDLGDYTTISYSCTAGDPINTPVWYKWRSPYLGLRYSKGDHLNPDDNTGSVSYGEKQVFYTHKIDTKTHVAYFITNKSSFSYKDENGNDVTINGSTTEREDGFSANSEVQASRGLSGINSQSTNPLRKLEKIILFSKYRNANNEILLKKIKTVFFEYDYSSYPGQPNSRAGAGKLTLKKVWMENDDVLNFSTKPYEFFYTYPSSLPNGFPTMTSSSPNYSDAQYTDRWGYYQENGLTKHQNNIPYVSQSGSPTDPAPYLLKRVRIPSGADILVQYEQNDYCYVQDKKAMLMVPLESSSTDDIFLGIADITSPQRNSFKININSLGLSSSDAHEYVHNLLLNHKRVFYRYKYNILPPLAGSGTTPCEFDVEGYGQIVSATWDGVNTISVSIGKTSGAPSTTDKDTPRLLAMEYLETAKHHLSACGSDGDQPLISGKFRSMMESVLRFASGPLYKSLLNPQLVASKSFIRLPIAATKKLGGGVRVRRLLTAYRHPDGGTVVGEYEKILGNEYIYTMKENGKTISSGVASNEPSIGNEENALVNLLEHIDGDLEGKTIAGQNREMYEGPIGESLLPGPSVGYRRVLVQSIVNTPSLFSPSIEAQNTGYTLHEYFTYKDKPSHRVHVSERQEIEESNKPFLGTMQFMKNKVQSSQGYSIIIRNIHGQKKGEYRYGGLYSDNNTSPPVESTVYEYFDPEEKVPIMSNMFRPIRYDYLGKEMEVCTDTRYSSDEFENYKVQISGSITALPWWFIPALFPYISLTDDELKESVTTKVITYSTIQKSVTTLKNGVQNRVENIAFDNISGRAILTKHTDGYDGVSLSASDPTLKYRGEYYSYSFPAHQIYDAMGQKGKSAGLELTEDDPSFGKLSLEIFNTPDCRLVIAPSEGNTFGSQQLRYGRAITSELMGLISIWDRLKITTSNGKEYTILTTAVNHGGGTVGYSLLNLFPIPTGKVKKVEVMSNKTNALQNEAYVLLLRDNIDDIINYAKDLEKKNTIATMLNKWLTNGGGSVNLNSSHPLTWKDANTGIVYDIPKIQNIVIGGGNTNYGIKCSFPNNNTLKLGYTYNNSYIGTYTIELPWNGEQKFAVNDCGELIYIRRSCDPLYGYKTNFTFRGGDRVSSTNGDEPVFLDRQDCLPTCPNVIKATATVFATNTPLYERIAHGTYSPGIDNLFMNSWKPMTSYTYNAPIYRGSNPSTALPGINTSFSNNESSPANVPGVSTIFKHFHAPIPPSNSINYWIWDYGVKKRTSYYGYPKFNLPTIVLILILMIFILNIALLLR